ncbi:MAG: hypothetical protein CFE44_18960 [Burkholderiales bacterium PBB4]|nr:MAG: hypothetical protein CFE44_18960 [Burkholderiales bacterium PBB4]
MKAKCILFSGALALTGVASAQPADKFDGSWTATWQGNSAVIEANFELSQDKGKWQTLLHKKSDPCVGRQVPIRVDHRTADTLKITLQFSEVI